MAPTLQEIAAMPYPASIAAMRKFHDPSWGIAPPDDGELRTFKVRVDWEIIETGSDTVFVQAEDAAQAKELAADEVAERRVTDGEFNVDGTRVQEIDPNADVAPGPALPGLFS